MSRFATIGGAAVLGLAGAYWLTKELRPEKDADDESTLGNQGNVDNSTAQTAGEIAAYNRCHTLHQQGHFPKSYVSPCMQDMLAVGAFTYKVKEGEINKYNRDTRYYAPYLKGKADVETLQGDWERVEAAGTFCGNVGANGGFPNTRRNVESCSQKVYDTGRYGNFIDNVSMRLLGKK